MSLLSPRNRLLRSGMRLTMEGTRWEHDDRRANGSMFIPWRTGLPVRHNGHMTRHILWDLGGTLIDSYPQIDRMLQAYVTQCGGTISVDDVAHLTRHSIAFAITALAERFSIPPDDLQEAYTLLKRAWEVSPPPVMDGAHDILEQVHSKGGLNLVITNRDRESARVLLNASGLKVDDLICAPDGYARKPDPDMYITMMRRHDLNPSDCLAVGDRPIDAVAAQEAGIRCVLLETPGIPLVADAVAATRITGLAQLKSQL